MLNSNARLVSEAELTEAADKLFACCLQFLIAKEDCWLERISSLSKYLLDNGYETNFHTRRKALIVRSLFARLSKEIEPDDKLLPRKEDLPNAS